MPMPTSDGSRNTSRFQYDRCTAFDGLSVPDHLSDPSGFSALCWCAASDELPVELELHGPKNKIDSAKKVSFRIRFRIWVTCKFIYRIFTILPGL